MKVILSRKGFDSTSGGFPSPILPDGTLLSLPIPGDVDGIPYETLSYKGKSYSEILQELSPKTAEKLSPNCHLDPDIRNGIRETPDNWVAAFGQDSAAETHLENLGVSEGDIFLFYGWFKETELDKNQKLRYKRNAPDLHIIYGYMEVGKIERNKQTIKENYSWHPHSASHYDSISNNCLYLPTEKCSLNNLQPGYGTLKFGGNTAINVLTMPGETRGKWDLPNFFREDKIEISYHNNETNGFMEGKPYFKSVGRGQEFVFEANNHVLEWVKDIIGQQAENTTQKLEMVNHLNYPDKEGRVYCRNTNSIMVLYFGEGNLCSKCEMCSGSLQGEGVECYWADYMPDGDCLWYVNDPEKEYHRVQELIKKGIL